MNNGKKYLLGLDLGTDSVGWCLTDENYNVIRKNGKSLWGARLFDTAEDASSRRGSRGMRRRLQRRHERIELLRTLFAPEVNKVDPGFFQRMNLSQLHKEDREEYFDSKSVLFNDSNINDAKFYKKYPTIYHLRKHLLESDSKEDIRLVYLAMHHMIKYRGNFLFEGRDFKAMDPNDMYEYVKSLNSHLLLRGDAYFIKEDDSLKESFAKIQELVSSSKGVNNIKYGLINGLGLTDPYIIKVVVPLISGGTVQIKALFELDDDPDGDVKKISTKDADYEGEFSSLSEDYSDDVHLEILKDCKQIADFLLIGSLLSGNKFLCDAMVGKYDAHKKDLILLKNYLKNDKHAYYEMFRKVGPKLNNYVRYVGSNNSDGSKKRFARCSKDEFYKYLKETLGLNNKDVEYTGTLKYIKDGIESGTFLDKCNSTDNGVFPYQLNLLEMKAILDKQSKFYPFLLEKDPKYGITTEDKIISILTYHIPYYVGPLAYNKELSKNTWVVRKNGEKIYPWNFDQIVDKDKTAEQFIKRMLNKCTYLNDQYCLPKNSLLFSYYSVLSEVNKLAINGQPIDHDTKMELIDKLYKKETITIKKIQSFFKAKYGEDVVITSSNDKEDVSFVRTSLSSYITFSKILGSDFVDSHQDIIENIINDIVLFTDKRILKNRIMSYYKFTPEQVNAMKNLSYTGYGRISKMLLNGITTEFINNSTGEVTEKTIIQLMEDTNDNLQQIIFREDYQFAQKIEEYNKSLDSDDHEPKSKDFIKDYLDELYVSPGMKRPIIQSYEIIEELKKIIHHPIDEFYVECTRSNKNDKKQKPSRKLNLIRIYDDALKFCKEQMEKEADKSSYKSLIENITEMKPALSAADESLFRSDKYFLYFLQLGRDMYSGKPIDLEYINDNSRYDIDHIIPQSLVKDDSLENRVLVDQAENRRKTDVFPIPSSVLAPGAKSLHYMLFKAKLIGEKKFHNLSRTNDLTDDEIASFVNRQLVYTNQAVDGLIKMIKKLEVGENGEDPYVVYSKAENVSDFRRDYDLLKCRDTNDFHHANDAYLNIVVGRTVDAYFKHGFVKEDIQIYKDQHLSLNTKKIFEPYKNSDRAPVMNIHNEPVWDYKETLKKVKHQVLTRFDILTTTRQYVGNTLFAQTTIHPAADFKLGGNLFAVKNPHDKNNLLGKLMDTMKYGGYCNLAAGYYSLVKSKDKKGKEFVSLEAMQNIYVKADDSVEKKEEYLKNIKGLTDPKIIVPVVRVNCVLTYKDSKFAITGKTNDSYVVKILSQCIYTSQETSIMRLISKMLGMISDKKNSIDDFIKIKEYLPIIDDHIVISPAKSKDSKELKLSESDLSYMYNSLISKLADKKYDAFPAFKRLSDYLKTDECKAKYAELNLYQKAKTISEIAKMLKCDREMSDLTLIGLAGKYGALKVTKNLYEGCHIINQSVTGFYTKKVY